MINKEIEIDKEIEIEAKIPVNKDTFENVSKNYLDTGAHFLIEKHRDYYFDTLKEDYKDNNSVLRVRHNLENNTYQLTHKVKSGNLNESTEFHVEISDKDFNVLLDHGGVLADKMVVFPYGKVYCKAMVEVERTRLFKDDYILDFDKTNFLNNYSDFEIEIEAKSEERLAEISRSLVEKFQIEKVPALPKIARYFKYLEEFIRDFPGNKIIVVEGRSDTNKLGEVFPKINTFETSGLGLTPDMLDELGVISDKNNAEIVIFTDPDVPGEKIRSLVLKRFPEARNAYLPQIQSISKNRKKVGIEHARKENIIRALSNLKVSNPNAKEEYTLVELIDLGIYKNKEKRNKFAKILGIAEGNNKKILKQLNNYGIPREKIIQAIKQIEDK